MRYVDVKEALKLFDQLQSWDKEEFLKQIGVYNKLDTYELRNILKRV